MNREERKALEAYVQALLPERERYLYQHALNKVRVITRSMKPAEKEDYLRSEAFRNTLRQVQRRDRIWQGLLRGELVLAGDHAEFERLSRLIEGEMRAGRKIDLAFLPKNLPYTMTDEEFIKAANQLKPKFLYAYHYFEIDVPALRAKLDPSIALLN